MYRLNLSLYAPTLILMVILSLEFYFFLGSWRKKGLGCITLKYLLSFICYFGGLYFHCHGQYPFAIPTTTTISLVEMALERGFWKW